MEAPAPRIVSLLPAATEIVAALGLRRALVGRSHECDEPADVATLPALTAPRIDARASSRQIHEQVGRAMTDAGGAAALYTLDADMLRRLEPDLVLTQAACAVCAVAADDVRAAVAKTGVPARVLELSPATLADVYADILAVGAATGAVARAREVVARLRARVRSVACRVQADGDGFSRHVGHPSRLQRRAQLPASETLAPRVAMLEWLDPPMAAGNWVPELITLAGGVDALGKAGEHSHWITWDDVITADPDVVVLAPCGFTVDRVVAEAETPAIRNRLKMLRAFRSGRIWALDGHHLVNRPGPRLVDSLEVLAEILHPGLFSFSATRRCARKL
ncbi:MAG: cobalamin-binding protein [Planctomycetes bacterium]|nr:cobalamin-binding protein [Planctomycetota bacterium]